MQTLEDAAQALNAKGYYTRRRDWSVGHSLLVSRGVKETIPPGIDVLDGTVYIAEPRDDGKWWVYPDIVAFPTDSLQAAVDAVENILKE